MAVARGAPEAAGGEVALARPSAASAALAGGAAAAAAQLLTVPLFMWLHTVTCYQHKHGGTLVQVARMLYAEGGIQRFYRGLLPTLLHTPLCRFGGIAATDGAFEALSHLKLPAAMTAMVASAGAAASRAVLMPLSALSTVQQVGGLEGKKQLLENMRKRPSSLWSGTSSTITATWLGHWVWCTADKQLRTIIPNFNVAYGKHFRNVLIGFLSSLFSDALTNPFRVLSTMRQTAYEPLSYVACARLLFEKGGVAAFVGRGLMSRILMNGMQGALLTLGWKAIAEKITGSR